MSRRARLTGGLLSLLTAALVRGCGGGGGGGGGGATPTTAASTTTSTAPATTTGATTTTEAVVLADGRHPVFPKTVDAASRKITFDLIQFLTGEAAAKAAAEDHQESPPPNDYYIRNTNPRLRTLPVRLDAPITVNTLAAEETGSTTRNVTVTLAKLAALLPKHPGTPVLWITVRSGEVTKIAEQYLP